MQKKSIVLLHLVITLTLTARLVNAIPLTTTLKTLESLDPQARASQQGDDHLRFDVEDHPPQQWSMTSGDGSGADHSELIGTRGGHRPENWDRAAADHYDDNAVRSVSSNLNVARRSPLIIDSLAPTSGTEDVLIGFAAPAGSSTTSDTRADLLGQSVNYPPGGIGDVPQHLVGSNSPESAVVPSACSDAPPAQVNNNDGSGFLGEDLNAKP